MLPLPTPDDKLATQQVADAALDKSEQEALYKGRKLPRTERLKQMRESQKRLRDRRNDELLRLRQENFELTMRLQKGSSVPEPGQLSSALNGLVAGNVSGPLESTSRYSREEISLLYVNKRDFFLVYVAEAAILCWSTADPELLMSGPLRFQGQFGPLLMDDLRAQTALFVATKRLPETWFEAKDNVGKGIVTFVGLVRFLLEHSNLRVLNYEILAAQLVEALFATPWGPCAMVKDVVLATEQASRVDLDEDYVSGRLAIKCEK